VTDHTLRTREDATELVVAVRSGPWDDPATWPNGVIPATAAHVYLPDGPILPAPPTPTVEVGAYALANLPQ
jgi:hypothetical protein